MKPLKIAILWHQHQPIYTYNPQTFDTLSKNEINYKSDNQIAKVNSEDVSSEIVNQREFLLPWVRLHGVKDYLDLPKLLFKYPNIKQTFNLVPSLFEQIKLYTASGIKDKVLKLTEYKAENLTSEHKKDILDSFFICNYENLISPNPRYKELYTKYKENTEDINKFSAQDYLDIQVWYNLCWIGEISKTDPVIINLIQKDRNFTEVDKQLLINFHFKILNELAINYKQLYDIGQISISISPYYHPILPLLVDTDSAFENMPNLKLEKGLFAYKEDANVQIKLSTDFIKDNFQINEFGMWPSEGSISNDVLNLLIENGLKWTASDETVYFNSTKVIHNHLNKYFPKIYRNSKGEILPIFFRDHILSDKLGFNYSNWNHIDAKNDFINYLLQIRDEMIRFFGEDALDTAVVTVILDGENCWEFYPNNGFDFLNSLYSHLETDNLIKTVTFDEISKDLIYNYNNYSLNQNIEILENIKAGSWINANFKIWIGHKEDKIAWKLLSNAREIFEENKSLMSEIPREEAYKYLLITESSDWSWWFGDEHSAPNRLDFDKLFRYNLLEFYEIISKEMLSKEINIKIPEALYFSIMSNNFQNIVIQQKHKITETFEHIDDKKLWENAGYYYAKSEFSAMHQIGAILDILRFLVDEKYIYFQFELNQKLKNIDCVNLVITNPINLQVKLENNRIEVIQSNNYQNRSNYDNKSNVDNEETNFVSDYYLEYKILTSKDTNNIITLQLNKSLIIKSNIQNNKKVEKKVEVELYLFTKTSDGEIRYPRQENLKIIFE